MSREGIERNLAAVRNEIEALNRRYRSEQLGLASALGEIELIQAEFEQPLPPGASAVRDEEETAMRHRIRAESYKSMVGRMSKLLEVFEKEAAAAAANGDDQKFDQIMHAIGMLSGQVELMATPSPEPRPAPDRSTLLSVLDEWVDMKKTEGVSPKYCETMGARIRDFVGWAGDRPMDKYTYGDLRKFATLLASVPANRTKRGETEAMTLEEAITFNGSLPSHLRRPTLAQKSIKDNYLSPLRNIFTYLSAEHGFISPFASAPVRVPKTARKTEKRRPLSVDELNVLFRSAAGEKRTDLKWLPLLATLTGARLGELVFLQGRDVRELEPGLWIIDITTNLLDDDEGEVQRPSKNEGSRRWISLHTIFTDAGFIDYVRSLRSGEWLFPASHRWQGKDVVNVPNAASKTMIRYLKKLGIHQPYKVVFHSTRHTSKDIYRAARVDERTHDMQTGHSQKTVGREYGSETLLPEDVVLLAGVPLPDGLDISPYLRSTKAKMRKQD